MRGKKRLGVAISRLWSGGNRGAECDIHTPPEYEGRRYVLTRKDPGVGSRYRGFGGDESVCSASGSGTGYTVLTAQ